MAGQQDPPPLLSPAAGERLPRSFYDRPVLAVAPDLLGCVVAHAGVAVRLTEVEAYDGTNDPGSHAYRGLTPRTAVMFGPPGGLYCYFTYGMHWCCNLVCGPDGVASAVLLRAGEVVRGTAAARERRGATVSDRDLARGPARLAQALGLGRAHNGLDTCAPDAALTVRRGPVPPASSRRTGPRVGVSGAGGERAAYPWRFWVDGEASVSAYRLAKPRRRAPVP